VELRLSDKIKDDNNRGGNELAAYGRAAKDRGTDRGREKNHNTRKRRTRGQNK
jgi:hypothetical protein